MRALAVLVGCLALAGCGASDRAPDAATVAESFYAALDRGDGEAACEALAPQTRAKLEHQEGTPCDTAILDLDLPRGATAAKTSVYVTSASVTLAQGGRTFLDESRKAGRSPRPAARPPRPDLPYECELGGLTMRAMFVVYLPVIVTGIVFAYRDRAPASLMRAFLRHNGLSLVFLALFPAAVVLQAIAGHADFNEDQDRHGDPRITLGRYVVSSEFGTAVMENWQSEYLQFTLFILSPSGWCSAARPSRRSSARRGASRTRSRGSASTPTRESPRWAKVAGLRRTDLRELAADRDGRASGSVPGSPSRSPA